MALEDVDLWNDQKHSIVLSREFDLGLGKFDVVLGMRKLIRFLPRIRIHNDSACYTRHFTFNIKKCLATLV